MALFHAVGGQADGALETPAFRTGAVWGGHAFGKSLTFAHVPYASPVG